MIARNSYGHACWPGVLAVSPLDDIEMPDEYMDEQIDDALDEALAELLMDTDRNDAERYVEFCRRLRQYIDAQIEATAPDLAEKMWMSDIDSSQQAAAEYAADRD